MQKERCALGKAYFRPKIAIAGSLGISRENKLKSRKALEALMSKGKRIKRYPLQLVYSPALPDAEADQKFKIAFSAPKRRFKKAVDRNSLKRRMRAAFRPFIPELSAFIEETGTAYVCMLIYVGSEKQSTAELESRLKLLLQRFKEECNTLRTDEQTQEDTPKA